MNNKTIRIYAKTTPERYETLFSGVTFFDFMESAESIENILLLKGTFSGGKSWKKFELIEGKNQIAKLLLENVHNYGDFCFLDYTNTESINQITDEQMAELLYLSHMFRPLHSPFNEVLHNKYVYLAHDDGWYCKLYCEDSEFPISILINRLKRSIKKAFGDSAPALSESVNEEIHKLSKNGLLIEFDVNARKQGLLRRRDETESATLKMYDVGTYDNPDDLFNNLEQIRLCPSVELNLP